MRFLSLVFSLLVFSQLAFGQLSKMELKRWSEIASAVEIVRDNWGIPHIYAKTDAQAVFGLMYAQCEDDFNRIEMNYIEKLGKMSMIEGEAYLHQDLYVRLIIDEEEAKKDYKNSPPWLRDILMAFSDGINYYLFKNPSVKTKVISRFEPWYPLLWTDGSIGAISTGHLGPDDVREFYLAKNSLGIKLAEPSSPFESFVGSNGFAIAGSNSATGNALLYINPHVSLYFRPEVHVTSEEGLNAYGAVTWGQFFVYQGFNEYNGWMHTSSNADVSDVYLEKIKKKKGRYYYEYASKDIRVSSKIISLSYKTSEGINHKNIVVYSTHHGPVMGRQGDQWLTVRSNNRSMDGLIQSWKRTKTRGFSDYKKVMDIRANTSNNTVYADREGNIAYWHGNFMPKRDVSFNWGKAVDGTVKETEWQSLHSVEETVHVYNPASGWIQNCNSTAFTVSGKDSPVRTSYPRYMAPDGENFRGINAVRLLSNQSKLTLEELITVGYDRYLSAFEKLVPALIQAYDAQIKKDTTFQLLKDPVQVLRSWDFRSGIESIPTTLAIEWGQQLIPKMTVSHDEDEYQYVDQVEKTDLFLKNTHPEVLLQAFKDAVSQLSVSYGTWKIAWGDINRFQRISGDITLTFSDSEPSLPLAFASSAWGMLPSYSSRLFAGTKKRYCVGGNSFICAVEFGTKIKARSLLGGGVSGHESSPHFNDQGEMYANGIFKDVLFYKEDVLKHAERVYHPGE